MSLNLMPSHDIGLQCTLKGGLAAIRLEDMSEDKRNQLLDALVSIFSEADKGSKALTSHSLLATYNEGPSLDKLSLFLNYLPESFGNDLSSRLAEATNVINAVRAGESQDPVLLNRVCEMIESLLFSIRREFALTPLASQRSFQY